LFARKKQIHAPILIDIYQPRLRLTTFRNYTSGAGKKKPAGANETSRLLWHEKSVSAQMYEPVN
jgi:hypothetical protein